MVSFVTTPLMDLLFPGKKNGAFGLFSVPCEMNRITVLLSLIPARCNRQRDKEKRRSSRSVLCNRELYRTPSVALHVVARVSGLCPQQQQRKRNERPKTFSQNKKKRIAWSTNKQQQSTVHPSCCNQPSSEPLGTCQHMKEITLVVRRSFGGFLCDGVTT